ncbi:Laminin Subunit Gamma-2 [Manis pentadactyla]|nr:Laminin Subunit Gamma-2 [Manis pentadactyla]
MKGLGNPSSRTRPTLVGKDSLCGSENPSGALIRGVVTGEWTVGTQAPPPQTARNARTATSNRLEQERTWRHEDV